MHQTTHQMQPKSVPPPPCPHLTPLDARTNRCGLVVQLAHLPPDLVRVPTAACAVCGPLQKPNHIVAGLAIKAARQYAPEALEAVRGELSPFLILGEELTMQPTEGRVVLDSDAHGFGDAMVTAWISEGSKGKPRQLVHYATGAMRNFLESFGQPVTDDRAGAVQTFNAYAVEARQEKGSVPRVISRGRALGFECEPVRPRLRELPEHVRQWADDLVGSKRGKHGDRPVVALFPQTHYRSREWPAAYWIDLAWRLHRLGYGTTIQLGTDEERWHNVPSYHYGHAWENLFAVMQRVDLVIGVDSAPAHVAGTIDRPTFALLGPTPPTVFAHCPSVECLAPGKDRMECVGCYFNYPFRAACDQGCMALSRLFVEDVLEKIVERIGPAPCRGCGE